MIVIIDTKEVVEDGVTYIVDTYSNGAVVKYTKLTGEPETHHLSDMEEAILETELNTEYLV